MVKVNAKCPAYVTGLGSSAIIVIQEWWGLNDNIERMADRLAGAGPFTVLAPDLYHGKVGHTEDEARHLMNGLDWDGALGDIIDAASYLRTQKSVGKLGVVGFCMGGALALKIASALGDKLQAGVVFYGTPKELDVSTIRAPLQLHFAGKDKSPVANPEALRALEQRLKEASKSFETHFYEDENHAFMNEDGKNYSRSSAEIGFARCLGFFKKHLLNQA